MNLFSIVLVAIGTVLILWVVVPILKDKWGTSKAVTVTETVALYSQYVAARGAVLQLRVMDATSGVVDLKAELDAIEQKLGSMFKMANSNPPPIQGV